MWVVVVQGLSRATASQYVVQKSTWSVVLYWSFSLHKCFRWCQVDPCDSSRIMYLSRLQVYYNRCDLNYAWWHFFEVIARETVRSPCTRSHIQDVRPAVRKALWSRGSEVAGHVVGCCNVDPLNILSGRLHQGLSTDETRWPVINRFDNIWRVDLSEIFRSLYSFSKNLSI